MPVAPPPSRAVIAWRIAWTVVSLAAVQTVIFAISVAPVVFIWNRLLRLTSSNDALRWALVSAAIAPSYVLFAVTLMFVSPIAVRLAGWHTPPDIETRIADMEWPLLDWVRAGASIHLARLCAGSLFRGTPLWTMHLRLHGARLGRRVFVNSLSVSDYNLIDCGDDVVIGAGVHLSGHTVEGGVVKTARVRMGSDVTIGLEAIVEIGVEIGSHVQVGALSFVPKYTRLAANQIYAGVPAAPLESTSQRNGDAEKTY